MPDILLNLVLAQLIHIHRIKCGAHGCIVYKDCTQFIQFAIDDLFHVCIGIDNNMCNRDESFVTIQRIIISIAIIRSTFRKIIPVYMCLFMCSRVICSRNQSHYVDGKCCYRIVACQFNQYCTQIYVQINFISLLLNAIPIVI